uniref:PDZ domain-containing protein n=1 Tax=Bursaphelenchus xylophilus TaxID=6326 RepID=A0A1I7SVP0_BURXY
MSKDSGAMPSELTEQRPSNLEVQSKSCKEGGNQGIRDRSRRNLNLEIVSKGPDGRLLTTGLNDGLD